MSSHPVENIPLDPPKTLPSTQQVLASLQNCEVMCEHMTMYMKYRYDVQYRVVQLQLLRDCADMCGITAKYIARTSCSAKITAGLCACICELCAVECAKFPDPESQHCAQVCLHCARDCRAFAMM
ncbi:MAG: four-helix bundle copper-binding protein [Thermotaleaceae bacterium]